MLFDFLVVESYHINNTNIMTKKNISNLDLKFAVLATDVVLFALKDGQLFVRLIAVDRPPAFPSGSCGFPGGLIRSDETAEQAASRIIEEKAKIAAKKLYFEQLYTFSQIDRDPRGRVVAVSYLAVVPWEKLSAKEQKNSDLTWWTKVSDIPNLAYDHNEMFKVAVARLKSRICYTTLIVKMLPREFTLGELERAYEGILNEKQDKRNFRKKIAKIDILRILPKMQTGEPFRPARLYEFKQQNVREIEII